MTEVDSSKKVYLFLHGRMDLHEKMLNSLENNGFQKENAVMGNPKQAGAVGDYMVQLWPPGPNPNHIKVQQITAVEECCLLYTSPSPRDATLSRMPSSA